MSLELQLDCTKVILTQVQQSSGERQRTCAPKLSETPLARSGDSEFERVGEGEGRLPYIVRSEAPKTQARSRAIYVFPGHTVQAHVRELLESPRSILD